VSCCARGNGRREYGKEPETALSMLDEGETPSLRVLAPESGQGLTTNDTRDRGGPRRCSFLRVNDCLLAWEYRRLITLLIRARRFNATLLGSERATFAALAKHEGVSRSYFTRVVRLSYLAPDITQAILDGRQPRDLTADKLLAHSRLTLAWHEQRTVLGFA
jgi:hypothetical protein